MNLRHLIPIFCFAAGSVPALATVLLVPQEYPAIQLALDAVQSDDTVFVAMGTYSEELLAPAHRFWLIGDSPADTTGVPRPTIDPSTLTNPQSRRCMYVPEGSQPTFERMAFVNRAPMYPRAAFDSWGGILVDSESPVTCRFCAFDSTYGGIVVWAVMQSNLIVEDCRFTNGTQCQVYAWANGRVTVRRSLFERHYGSFVAGNNGSLIEACRFFGDSITYAVFLTGANVRISSCEFSPIGVCLNQIVHIDAAGQTNVEGNSIHDVQTRDDLVYLSWSRGEPITFRNNTVANIVADSAHASCGVFVERYVDADSGQSAIIDSNCFENLLQTPYGTHGKALTLAADVEVRANRFSNLLPASVPSVAVDSPDPINAHLRLNRFEATDYAVTSQWISVDAIYNYWGDPTGPFNALHNPQGLGARVDDLVLFDPWSPDTNFLSAEKPCEGLLSDEELRVTPNPFNGETRIRFDLDRPARVDLNVYDLTGRLVANLCHERRDAGRHEVTFSGENLASGMYFVKLSANDQNRVQKVLLLK